MEDSSLQDVVDLYIAVRRPSTPMARQVQLVVRLLEQRGMKSVSDLKMEGLLRWREKVLADCSPVTWNNYRRHLQAALRVWMRVRKVTADPLADVGSVPTPKAKPKVLPLDVIGVAISHLETEEACIEPAWFWRLVLLTLYGTGIRRRQLVGLTWPDIDFEASTCRLRATWSKTLREWVIPLPEYVLDGLKDLKKRTLYERGSGYLGHGQVFNLRLFKPTQKGENRQMTVHNVDWFFRRISELGGEQRISAHRMRHTFASQLAPEGDLKSLQELLGHTTLSTTMVYVHTNVTQMKDLVSKLRPPFLTLDRS